MKTVSKNPNLSDNNLKGSRKNYHPDEMKELKIGDFHSSTLQNCNCANAHRETGSIWCCIKHIIILYMSVNERQRWVER